MIDLKDRQIDVLTSALTWVADKDNTYTKDVYHILSIARAALNVATGTDYKIPEQYDYLIQEFKDEFEE